MEESNVQRRTKHQEMQKQASDASAKYVLLSNWPFLSFPPLTVETENP